MGCELINIFEGKEKKLESRRPRTKLTTCFIMYYVIKVARLVVAGGKGGQSLWSGMGAWASSICLSLCSTAVSALPAGIATKRWANKIL